MPTILLKSSNLNDQLYLDKIRAGPINWNIG